MSRTTTVEKNMHTLKGEYCQQDNSLVPCLNTSGVPTAITSYFLYHSQSALIKYKLCSLFFFVPYSVYIFAIDIFTCVKRHTNFLQHGFFPFEGIRTGREKASGDRRRNACWETARRKAPGPAGTNVSSVTGGMQMKASLVFRV